MWKYSVNYYQDLTVNLRITVMKIHKNAGSLESIDKEISCTKSKSMDRIY